MNFNKGDLIEYYGNYKLFLYINNNLIILLFDLKNKYIIKDLNRLYDNINDVNIIKFNDVNLINFNKLKFNIYDKNINKELFITNFYKICNLLLYTIKKGDTIYCAGNFYVFNINILIHTMLFVSFERCSIIHKTKKSKNSVSEILLNFINIEKEKSALIEEKSIFEVLLARKYFNIYNFNKNIFIVNKLINNEEVVNNAIQMIGKDSSYNIINNNCQTFINNCKYNNNITHQLDILRTYILLIVWPIILFIILVN